MSNATTPLTINITSNGTNETETGQLHFDPMPIWKMTLVLIICSIFIIGTLVGNILVFLSVGIVKKLRTPSNLLIVSLAAADFLVGLIVMPFAAVYTVMNQWILGPTECDAWTSSDVLLCTSSILNLCVISIDRYLVITQPFKYAIKRTPKRMGLMIAAVWLISALISIPPLFGWRSESEPGVCQVSQNRYYQIYATMFSFYIPLIAMIFVYYRIYRVSHKIALEEAKSKPQREELGGDISGVTTPLRRDSEEPGTTLSNGGIAKKSDASGSSIDCNSKIQTGRFENKRERKPKPKISFFRKYTLKGKESKAVKTLGVIMGAFTICWLPFFILALIKPFCADCIPGYFYTITLWLGYANSFLNPIIYARFNRDFRKPFKEILLCRCCGINDRLRHELYSERFGGASVRNSLRPPQHSVVRYQSQGQTLVELGNGDVRTSGNGAKV